MTPEQIQTVWNALIAVLPALASILGVVLAALNVIKKFKEVIKSGQANNDALKTENDMLKGALRTSMQESDELKKTQRKLLAKLEHVDEADLEV